MLHEPNGPVLSIPAPLLRSEVIKDTRATVGEVMQRGVVKVERRVELLLNVLGQQMRNT